MQKHRSGIESETSVLTCPPITVEIMDPHSRNEMLQKTSRHQEVRRMTNEAVDPNDDCEEAKPQVGT